MITIIVPVYNIEQYLPKCLESLCAQDSCVREILLINDGSTDNSLEICQRFAEKDSRIKIINQENKGLSATVRVGVKAASCEYIGFVDGDDYIDNSMYEVLFRQITENKADMAICEYDLVDENGSLIEPCKFGVEQSGVYIKENNKFPLSFLPQLLPIPFISPSRCIRLFTKSSLINSFAFEDKGIRTGEDFALVTPILMGCDRIAYIKKPFYHYMQRTSSITHTYNRNNLDDWKKVCQMICKAVDEYRYDVGSKDALRLGLLKHICLCKIRDAKLTRKEKKQEFCYIRNDTVVTELLRSKTFGKMSLKNRLLLWLLRHKFCGVLSFA